MCFQVLIKSGKGQQLATPTRRSQELDMAGRTLQQFFPFSRFSLPFLFVAGIYKTATCYVSFSALSNFLRWYLCHSMLQVTHLHRLRAVVERGCIPSGINHSPWICFLACSIQITSRSFGRVRHSCTRVFSPIICIDCS